MELYNNNHSVFSLYYHLVLVVKYRRKVFSEPISQYAKDIFMGIGTSYHITFEEEEKIDLEAVSATNRELNAEISRVEGELQAQLKLLGLTIDLYV